MHWRTYTYTFRRIVVEISTVLTHVDIYCVYLHAKIHVGRHDMIYDIWDFEGVAMLQKTS